MSALSGEYFKTGSLVGEEAGLFYRSEGGCAKNDITLTLTLNLIKEMESFCIGRYLLY